MDKPKNSTKSSKKKQQKNGKVYDINGKKKQKEDTDTSDVPDQPLADMNE